MYYPACIASVKNLTLEMFMFFTKTNLLKLYEYET